MPLYGADQHLPIAAPITINRDSPQAFGLCQWYPGMDPAASGGSTVPEYVSGFKKAFMNGSGHFFPDASNISGPFGSAFPFAAPFFDGIGIYMTELTYSGGSATGPQNGPQPFPIAPPFSVSVWIRAWGNYTGCIWWMGRENAGSWYAHYLYYSKTTYLVSANSVDNNGFRTASSSIGSILPRTWYHVCGVWNSTTDRRIYVNGIHHQTNTNSSNPDLSSGCLIAAGAERTQFNWGNFWQGHICDLRMYRRALSTPEIVAIYDPSTRFDLFKSRRYSRPSSPPAAAAGTSSGNAAVTVGAATCSGSATHTAPIYTGNTTVTCGAATCSGSATHTAPSYTGDAAVTCGAATCSGSATHTAPSYTGNAAVTCGAATASGTATFTAPIYSGNAAVTVGAATCSGAATFTDPIYSGNAAVVTGPATATGTATFTSTTRTGTAAVTTGAATASGTATFVAPAYDTGTGYVNFADQYFFGDIL